MLDFINTKQSGAVWTDFKKLYVQAFPKAERLPWWFIRKKAKTPVQDCFCVYDNGNFVGEVCLLNHKDITLIFYLAVNDNVRGAGYGSAILNDLKLLYPNNRFILFIERVDENAPNYEERVKRLSFYQKNGYVGSGYLVSENKVVYQTMHFGGVVDKCELKELLINYMGKLLYKFYYKFPNE